MNRPFFSDPSAWQRLHVGPLSPYIDPFEQHLSEQGYAVVTIVDKLRVVAKFSRWLEHHQRGVEALDEQLVGDFLRELHQRERRTYHGDLATLQSFLEQLRGSGILTTPSTTVDESKLARLERDYALYLHNERGLSDATLRIYLPFVRRFLLACFSQGSLDLEQLRIRDVSRFVLDQAPKLGTGRAKLMVTALRSFFLFLQQRGDLRVCLAAAVPTVAHWRLSTVPKYLEPKQVERLLQHCDQNTVVGQRDYTMLLLLARLGLRAGELVHVCLDDIDWHSGLITVRGKGNHADRLPLPVDVGEALAKYLRDGRPSCATRRLFVRMKAPRVGFASSVAIDSMVRRALKRADLEPACKGAHLLRHSLATRMLRQGSSLVEIGQLLRHRLPQTTEIYAKIDQAALVDLAQPWPGGVA
ncbi:MAG: site-specific integrase [Motiliproteus sp.]